MPDEQGRPVDSAGFAIERRRPGRREVSPELIPILRRPAGDGVVREEVLEVQLALSPGSDPMSAARGIAMSLVLSLPLWCCVGAVGFALI